jgi:hypothetical protein
VLVNRRPTDNSSLSTQYEGDALKLDTASKPD